jgi:hypothetical protein
VHPSPSPGARHVQVEQPRRRSSSANDGRDTLATSILAVPNLMHPYGGLAWPRPRDESSSSPSPGRRRGQGGRGKLDPPDPAIAGEPEVAAGAW